LKKQLPLQKNIYLPALNPSPEKSALPHRAGFVSIIGKPNVGKSTLMNVLVGERLSIITSKAQTTRHRIMGIINGADFQIVYSDTPGIIKPQYELHKSMMRFVYTSLDDADIILFITDIFEKYDEEDVIQKLKQIAFSPANADEKKPVLFLLINKIDLATQEEVQEKIVFWQELLNPTDILAISALTGFNTENVLPKIMEHLPEHPPYFEKDALTDKPERFFASEILREKIFLNYKKEIPYSSEVVITAFNEKEDIIVVQAEILVERESQKGIIIGDRGKMLKKTGTQARQQMELFFQKKIFLETFVKVEPDWRSRENTLKRFGYNET
jgi:GTPase